MKTSKLNATAHYEPLDETWFRKAGVSPVNKEHLLNSNRSLEQGRAPTPSFKLYGKTDESLIDDFFNSIEGKVEVADWMLAYEQGRKAKFGPQGGYKSWDILGPLLSLYQTRLAPCQGDRNVDYYKSMNLQMYSADKTVEMLKKDKQIEMRAAGCPDFALKKTDIIAQRNAIKAVNSGRVYDYFGYVFSRYSKLKPRIFMPMPFSSMIDQARWFKPFLSEIQRDLRANQENSAFTFWADKIGFANCFDIFNKLMKKANLPAGGLFIHSGRDFEKMDTTTGTSQYMKLFIPTIAEAFNYKPGSRPYAMLEKSMLMTTQMPIASPYGMMVGDHGTASGAEVTNGGETVCNDHYSAHAEKEIAAECSKVRIQYEVVVRVGNGDDGATIYYLYDPNRLDEFKKIKDRAYEKALKLFGFRGNPDKDHWSVEYGLYCQNMVWIEQNEVKWAYPATLILNSIVNPEKQYNPKDWDKDYRDLDIIEKLDNGCGLPYFHNLIDFVNNGMKFKLLGTSEKETSRILSKWDKYRALQPLTERFNRQDYNISNSPTIKYLLSQRVGQI